MTQATCEPGGTLPVFRAGPEQEMEDFAAVCGAALCRRPPRTGTLPFRIGVVQLTAAQAPAFVRAEERHCWDSFGQTVVRLDRAQLRRGRFVTLFPEMEAEGLPCEVLCLDLTDGPVWPEDGGELVAVLEFLGRFCQEGAVAWVLAEEADAAARALETALEQGGMG